MAKRAKEGPVIVAHKIGSGQVVGAKLTFGSNLPVLLVQIDGSVRELLVESPFWQALDDEIAAIFSEFFEREEQRQASVRKAERRRELLRARKTAEPGPEQEGESELAAA